MEDLNPTLKNICGQLYDIGVLKFGNFTMKVGVNSPVYFDLRICISHPTLMENISDIIQKYMDKVNVNPKLICGVPYTALPFSTLVSVQTKKPMLLRRKEPKKYGTMKLIEGSYEIGDSCVIIEDVVTSGSSILETVKDLRRDGLVVTDTIVILDREQGGQMNLINNGIKMHSLLTLSKVLEHLLSLGKIDNDTVSKVQKYIQANQILPNGEPLTKMISKTRLSMTFGERALLAQCPLAKRIFNLMEEKRSNLCIAVDVCHSADILKLVEAVGEHAVVIKTHFDMCLDWNEETENSLIELSKKHNFLIMEDRKYSDIGNTVNHQINRVSRWADTVTFHTTAGPALIPTSPTPLFLIAQLTCAGNLISDSYTRASIEMAHNNKEIVAGLCLMDGELLQSPEFIQLRPGVSVQKGGDNLGQQYISVDDAVLVKGGDLLVVGRAIYSADDPQAAANELKEIAWTAYERRVKGFD